MQNTAMFMLSLQKGHKRLNIVKGPVSLRNGKSLADDTSLGEEIMRYSPIVIVNMDGN
jgi:hypothetical protein